MSPSLLLWIAFALVLFGLSDDIIVKEDKNNESNDNNCS